MSERYLLRFSRKDALKFIGHLDALRVFRQSVRRAGLPVTYSQGFNPHMLLSFALPLPLGMDSENDYAELTLDHPLPPDECIARFNTHAPGGLRLTGAKPTEEGTPGVAARTAAADYIWRIPATSASGDIPAVLQALLDEPSLIIPKKTKSGVKDTDIRPDLFDLHAADGAILLRLSAGSARFVSPLLAAALINDRLGLTSPPSPADFTRVELYDAGFISLFGGGA